MVASTTSPVELSSEIQETGSDPPHKPFVQCPTGKIKKALCHNSPQWKVLLVTYIKGKDLKPRGDALTTSLLFFLLDGCTAFTQAF